MSLAEMESVVLLQGVYVRGAGTRHVLSTVKRADAAFVPWIKTDGVLVYTTITPGKVLVLSMANIKRAEMDEAGFAKLESIVAGTLAAPTPEMYLAARQEDEPGQQELVEDVGGAKVRRRLARKKSG